MRILVCGGRDFKRYTSVTKVLDELTYDECPNEPQYAGFMPQPDTVIISGCATGADTHAIDWSVVNWVLCEEYPADWKTHGKAAGHIRNQQMLDEGKPDLVVAFPGGRGTADMIRRAMKAQVPVRRYDEWGEEILDG